MALTSEVVLSFDRARREGRAVIRELRDSLAAIFDVDVGLGDIPAEARDAAQEIERLDGVLAQIGSTIDVDFAVDDSAIKEAEEAVGRLDGSDPTVKVNFDDSEIQQGRDILDRLDGSNPTIKANFDDSEIVQARDVLDRLDDSDPTIRANVNTTEIEQARGLLASIDEATITPKIEPDTTAVGELQGGFLTELTSALENPAQQAGKLAGAAVAAALADSFLASLRREDLTAELQTRFALSESDTNQLARVAGAAYGTGFAESSTAAFTAAGDIADQLRIIGDVNDEQLQRLTVAGLNIEQVFGATIPETIRAAGQLVRTGLATDFDEAFDLITSGFQRGLDRSGDFLDTLNEYAPQFEKIGIDGADALALLEAGLSNGAFNADKVADSLKELSVRVVEDSETMATALASVGLDETIGLRIAEGGETARAALQEIFEAIAAIEDPQRRINAAIEIFGTQAEDLGPRVVGAFANVGDTFSDVEGSAVRMSETLQTTSTDFRSSLATVRSQLAPLGQDVADAFTLALNAIDDLPDAAVALGGFAAAATAATAAFGPLGLAAATGLFALSTFAGDAAEAQRVAAERTEIYRSAVEAANPVNAEYAETLASLIDRYNGVTDAAGGATEETAKNTAEIQLINDLLSTTSEKTQEIAREFFDGTEIDLLTSALDTGVQDLDGFVDALETSGKGLELFEFTLGNFAETAEDANVRELADSILEFVDANDLGAAAARDLSGGLIAVITAAQGATAEIEEDTETLYNLIGATEPFIVSVKAAAEAQIEAGNTLTPWTAGLAEAEQALRQLDTVGDGLGAILGIDPNAAGLIRDAAQAVRNLGDSGNGLGSILDVDVDAIALYEQQISGLAERVGALFGSPFTPAITDEDVAAYIDRVLELQAAASTYRINLLRLEEELDETEFGVLQDTLEAVGEETGALFAQQLVEKLGTEDFTVLAEKLTAIAQNTELGQILVDKIGQAQLSSVPVDIELNDEQLRNLADQLFGIEVTASLDDSELVDKFSEDFNVNVVAEVDDSQIDALEDRTVFFDAVLSTDIDAFLANLQDVIDQGQVFVPVGVGAATGGAFANDGSLFFDRGGAVDHRGGFIADNPGAGVPFLYRGGVPYVAGEAGVENVEFGPNGIAVVGPGHEARLSMRRLEKTGVWDRIKPVAMEKLLHDFPTPSVAAPPVDVELRREMRALREEVSLLRHENDRNLRNVQGDTSTLVDSNEVTAIATDKMAHEKVSKPPRHRGRQL